MAKNSNNSAVFKYNRVQEQAILESEKAKPSSEPSFWAKSSCNQCYGRGVTGTIRQKVDSNIVQHQQLCLCAKKRFVRWRDEWVAEYISKHTEPSILESAVVVDNHQ